MSLYVPVFEALNDMQVRYVVVGGLATVLHGYARMLAQSSKSLTEGRTKPVKKAFADVRRRLKERAE